MNTGDTQAAKFGPWLDYQIRSRGWNQPEFARRIGMTAAAVYRWTVGERVPSTHSCDIIADVLGLPLDDVLTIAGHRTYIPKEETEEVIDKLRPLLDLMESSDLDLILTVSQNQAYAAQLRVQQQAAESPQESGDKSHRPPGKTTGSSPVPRPR